MPEPRFTPKQVAALVTAAALGAGTFGGVVGPRLPFPVAGASSTSDDNAHRVLLDAHAAQLRVLRAICIRVSENNAERVECTK